MKKITWNKDGYLFDEEPGQLISGEFPYFRVPAEDWRERLRLFKDAGGNAVATYIPWIIHEPEEGNFCFGDCPNRDLATFLSLCREMEIPVAVRPGPYVYSELKNDGLPNWLVRDYPQILARDAKGRIVRPNAPSAASYLHPVFLEKTRRYYHAVAGVLRPFLWENGGPIYLLQLDNEMSGIHIWSGTLDYNSEAMGIGKADGRYTRWLAAHYPTIQDLNRAYGKDYADYVDVRPVDEPGEKGGYFGGRPSNVQDARRNRDYADFYHSTKAEYLRTLRDWMREDGITTPISHNPPSMKFIADFEQCAKEFGSELLLGTDTYYVLNGYSWPQNNPTPQYAVKILLAVDFLKELGQPPTTFELQGGSPCDFPPVLPEDIEACYMLSTGMGMKGLNYYIYTGGPNFQDTGLYSSSYDFNAMISADGRIRPTYYAMKSHNEFSHSHTWLQGTKRTANVTVGFTWEDQHWDEEIAGCYSAPGKLFNARQCREFMNSGLLVTMMGSGYLPELCEIGNGLPLDRLAYIPCCQVMARQKQEKLVAFLKEGGRAIIGPVIPEMDERYEPCTILADALGLGEVSRSANPDQIVVMDDGRRVHRIQWQYTASSTIGTAIGFNERTNEPIIWDIPVGSGRALWMGAEWRHENVEQQEFLAYLFARMGTQEIIRGSNRCVWETVWQNGDRACVFVYNLYSGAQETDLSVCVNGKWHDCGHIHLPAMKVICIDLDA